MCLQDYKNYPCGCPKEMHRTYQVYNFHIAPDGKLYYTNIHKFDEGTDEFCIEHTNESRPLPKCVNGTTKYDEQKITINGKFWAWH